MSYPRLQSAPAASPTQDEIDAATRKRTLDGMDRCLALLVGQVARDWRDCGKAACKRSRRCRGFACEPGRDEYAPGAREASHG
jgi:hypothetical protein